MLYYLFKFLDESYNIPGAGLFQFISFRSAAAITLSLAISMIFGKKVISFLQNKQVGESIRNLGLEGQMKKQGTPTMGGLLILLCILLPTLLFARLDNLYIQLMILSTVWMGVIGFIDDYIKVFKKDKRGLAAQFKVIGQVGLGLLVGTVLYFHEGVVIKKEVSQSLAQKFPTEKVTTLTDQEGITHYMIELKRPITTIPFIKSHEFNYAKVLTVFNSSWSKFAWIVFIPMIIIIITAVSNGANLTDGIDGLASGTSAIIGFTLLIFSYVSGNIIFSNYVDVMYIPNSGELSVFAAAFVGACIGFLWYNAYPAQVFMGDTGSLALGGIIASMAIILRKELMIPILCGVFLVENLSVVLQVSFFKYTKKRFGEGRRIFLMSPLHHHYQKLGMPEPKIVSRFWIVGILLAILTIATLKVR